jgi:hypothetical protein
MNTRFLTAFAISAVISFIQASALARIPKAKDGAIVYDFAPWMRGLLHCLPPILSGLTAWAFLARADRVTELLVSGFLILSLFGQPNNIRLDATGVTSWGWLQRRRHIEWQDVVRIAYKKNTGNTMVYGKDGTRICHTSMHDDYKGFQTQLENHTHLPLDVRGF